MKIRMVIVCENFIAAGNLAQYVQDTPCMRLEDGRTMNEADSAEPPATETPPAANGAGNGADGPQVQKTTRLKRGAPPTEWELKHKKRCTKCKAMKRLADFNRSSDRADGHKGECRTCTHDYQRRHKAKKAEQRRQGVLDGVMQ